MANKPKIRFKGFDDAWEQRKLEDIYGSIGNAFVGTATPYYVESGHFYLESNNIKDGQINHNTEVFINDEFYEKQKDKWLHTGDMVMVQSGHVGHAAVIPEELNNSAAHALIMFRNPKEEIEPYFLNYQYQTLKSKKKIENITTGNTIKHILASEMQQFEVDMPELAEQKKIAEYFSGLDHLITLHQRKCDQMKELKKYMLTKMFPQNGAKVPEIRFDGFTDDWEQRKLNELLEKYEDPVDTPHNGYERIGIRSHAKGTFHSFVEPGKELDTAKMHRVASDKFILNITFAWEHAVAITDENDAGKLVSHRFPQFSFDEKLKSHFFKYLMLDRKFKEHLELSSPGGAGRNRVLKISDMLKYEIKIPSIGEQTKIAKYLDELDHLITLHQSKCENLKNLKKYMLRNMFV